MPPYIIAVDLGGTQIRAALCEPDGQILRRAACLTLAQEGLEPVLARIFEVMDEVMQGVPHDQIAGIGAGAPGPLNPLTGTILNPPNLPGWTQVPLRTMISEHFGVRTFLGNDANIAALAEHLYGAAHGIRDVVYLTISTGIGSGVIAGGRLLLGANGMAAEAGHMTIDPEGPVCGCGRRGHLEALASGPAIARDVVRRIRHGKKSRVTKLVDGDLGIVTARVVNEAAQAGDRVAIGALRRAGRSLGIGITNLLHIFNPRIVVLGGSVTKVGPLLFDPMRETIEELALPQFREGVAIVQAALGDDVGLLGALALAATELQFARPDLPCEEQQPNQ